MSRSYQTIILLSDGGNADLSIIAEAHRQLSTSGSLFILWNHRYSADGLLTNPFFEIIEEATKQSLIYVNTIILPKKSRSRGRPLKNNVQYLIWLIKDRKTMQFNKDAIREKHIWKDVEWGGRSKNYNPKGKDPGNVWIPTTDDGRGHITEHIVLDTEEWINRCLASTTKEDDPILIYAPKAAKVKTSKLARRKVELQCLKDEPADKPSYYIAPPDTKTKELTAQQGVIIFDTSEKMSTLKTRSVDLMITSPPYWDLKNYLKTGEIGQESYAHYVKRMEKVWQESYRVLKDSGSAFININLRVKDSKPLLIPLDIIRSCEKIGFKLVDIIIWHKSSGIPTNAKNLVSRHEYVLWFVKGSSYKFKPSATRQICDYKSAGLNHGLLWNLNRKAGSVGNNFVHPAIFPLALTDRIIELTSDPGDLVLDPFLGSGTTLISALTLKRNSINYEYNEGFQALIKHRLDKEGVSLNNVSFVLANASSDKSRIPIFRNEMTDQHR